MGPEGDLEKRHRILQDIMRASHFEWLDTALSASKGVGRRELVLRYWTKVGVDTAKAYLRRIDGSRPVPRQVADMIAFSSVTMGEDAQVVPGKDDSEAFVEHQACPWWDWHQKMRMPEEDLPGCDAWFSALVGEVGRALGIDLRVETREAMPLEGPRCVRRIWQSTGAKKRK